MYTVFLQLVLYMSELRLHMTCSLFAVNPCIYYTSQFTHKCTSYQSAHCTYTKWMLPATHTIYTYIYLGATHYRCKCLIYERYKINIQTIHYIIHTMHYKQNVCSTTPAIQTATHVSALLQTLYEVLRWESITFNKATLVLTVLHETTPGVIVGQQVPVTYSNTGCTHTCTPHSRPGT